jgi:hypothetical protein
MISSAQSDGQKALVTAKEAAAAAVEAARQSAAQQSADIRSQLQTEAENLRADYAARKAALIAQVRPLSEQQPPPPLSFATCRPVVHRVVCHWLCSF